MTGVPRLDPPGAGVSLFQRLLFTHIIAPFVAGKSDWQADSARFATINADILAIAEQLPEEKLQKCVLVPPQMGLEDSSRYWSVAMTLEHLLIVGEGIAKAIVALSNGVVPDRKVDTAQVKPKGGLPGAEVIAAYRAFAARASGDIDAATGNRASAAALTHPWFGPLTAHQWHWLLATHAGIHLKQIRAIIKGL